MKFDYNFNFSFTRADENHENTYHVGMVVTAANLREAQGKLAVRNSHLTVVGVPKVIAIYDEDGELMYVDPDFDKQEEGDK